MKLTAMSRIATSIFVLFLAAGCTNPSPGSDGNARSVVSTSPSGATEASDTSANGSSVPPVVRPEANSGQQQDGWWIGWVSMNEDRVELQWAGLETTTLYRLYRFETAELQDPMTVELDSSHQVFDGSGQSYSDSDVEPDTFYTYIIAAGQDGASLDRRWTQVLTTTDLDPPTDIQGLSAQRTADGVVLSWEVSSDNVEFASYSVSIEVGGNLTYVGGGADPNQTSFVDPKPSRSPTTYVVEAVDFHNNRSKAARVTV